MSSKKNKNGSQVELIGNDEVDRRSSSIDGKEIDDTINL